jgi:polyhydroxyalkanoate synthesis regulator phasin
MPSGDDESVFQRLRKMGEQQANRLVEEMLSNPRVAEALGKTIQTAMETKGRVDRNMQTVLSLLNLPSKADYRKLATKVEALQGSLVNLSIKLDRILAEQQKTAAPPKAKRGRGKSA